MKRPKATTAAGAGVVGVEESELHGWRLGGTVRQTRTPGQQLNEAAVARPGGHRVAGAGRARAVVLGIRPGGAGLAEVRADAVLRPAARPPRRDVPACAAPLRLGLPAHLLDGDGLVRRPVARERPRAEASGAERACKAWARGGGVKRLGLAATVGPP